MLIASEHRQAQAQRTVDKQLLTPSAQEVKAFKKLCRMPFTCEADARQALATWRRHESRHKDGWERGRPGSEAQLPRWSNAQGALASSLAARQACDRRCHLATNALAEAARSPQAVLTRYKGQAQAERGFRFLKDPPFLASSRYLKKPERIMALLMVMTVCLLVYAA